MTDSIIREDYDVVVVGGGPSGAASSTVLAQSGFSVLVLERSEFPRFHIGESMLAYGAAMMRRLGIVDAVRDIGFPVKTGAEFCDPDGSVRRVDFMDQGTGRELTTFQVERSEFDTLLLRHAARSGAEVRHGVRVSRVETSDGRITGVRYRADGQDRLVRARWVIDASGRAGLIVSQHIKARKPVNRQGMVAVFKHFTGVCEQTNPGVAGDIQIGSHDDGWVWAIPIRHDKLSVGAVTPPETLRYLGRERAFTEHVQRIPRIQQRLEGATVATALRAENDFTYYSETVAGPGFFVVGDAGCFVDPIFSAGVYLALCTGYRAGEMTADLLSGRRSEEEVTSLYTRFYKTGYDTYFRVIFAFYQHHYKFGRFLRSTGTWVEPVWVARLLGGDFWSRKNALANHLRGVREYATFSPFEPLYGCPVYPDIDAAEPEPRSLGPRL